ncbi:methyltransferase family protein [Haloactinopolyspora alba]|uniref:Methyltransferase family protein n=1 Tax=Haloactinopolyspora alba TaxID=648780 RepID=A0A2P8DLX2_9ACTN|nr:class I SAM-dependent methyltransferase [Haloactinopolyspora alba]PSK98230.1 methyltransferase family protein [Haloactinopolyspora alba]
MAAPETATPTPKPRPTPKPPHTPGPPHAGTAHAHDEDARWYADVARSLARPGDRLAVDIGCGDAGMCVALDAALPRRAFVVGVDHDGDVLDEARRHMNADGIDDGHIRLIRADLDTDLTLLPEVVRGADIIWASASIHHLADQQAAVDALSALLAPGGRLALAEGGLPGHHLPWDLGVGEPGMEARLLQAEECWFTAMRASIPGSVRMPYGWTTALRRAGLTDVESRTFTFEKPAPLCAEDLSTVLERLARRVDRTRDDATLPEQDAAAWQRLLDPADDAYLGRREDIYSLRARTVHLGYRAE